ncbi:MAG TPA: amino acid adenylation domain-containing protein [Thermoanaerobaculia bacterium]|nr:amino acid adenylation domain-containing protein [Thermoanaerobaculia bacterium]
MNETEERAQRLEDQLELLERLMAEEQEAPFEVEPALPILARRDDLPLSFAQQRLWFLDQWEGRAGAYTLAQAFRLKGQLAPAALRRSLDEVVRRHEVLRTRIATVAGRPVQSVAPAGAAGLPAVDLSGLRSELREAEAASRLAREAREPFDLARGPLLRLLMLRLDAREHVLLFSMHHIVSDAWSTEILIREVAELYAAALSGRAARLPDLPVQYADFAAWQRAWLEGEVLESQLTYWRGRLAGAPELLELPVDRPRPASPSFSAAIRALALPPDTERALAALGRKLGATPFMVLLAAFQALLGRHCGCADLVIGSPIAGRTRPEVERLIGFFVNTVALRADLAGDPSFRDLVGRARTETAGAFAHQDLPFEKLVDELGLSRTLSYTPLVQAVLAYGDDHLEALELPGLRLERLDLHSGRAKFDLVLAATQSPDRFTFVAEYRTELFDATTIERLLGQLERLLVGIAADPECRVWTMPLLGDAERHQMIVEWPGGTERGRAGATLVAGFEDRVARSPVAPAVSCDGRSWSYDQLDRRANRLAHRLLDLGVLPGSRVCLCAERGLPLVAGILGILKAGCAYVPLDPAYPRERLAYLQADSGAPALVVGHDLLDRFDEHRGPRVDLDEALASGPEDWRPAVAIDGAWPAYVIYTSGSTGRPKGVVVTHDNVVRLFAATRDWFGFTEGDVWTLFHSYAFDFSVWEIWGALLYGGRLEVVPYWVSRSPEAFLALLERERVTVLCQTPSAFRQLQRVEAGDPELRPLALRWVIFGGEALEPRSLVPWAARRGTDRPRLINMYGITETTVHVTYRRVRDGDIAGTAASVIGVPIPDLSIYVLDPRGRVVPPGVAGEIVVGGLGVATGYLGRPELTAERFAPDPFGVAPGARLYRSGDLGRWLAMGELEYLGRIDHQVKLRGFRIELGEIEAALAGHAEVADAVVLIREDTPGDRRLVAYVVGAAGALPDREELRAHLAARLPDYMVPAVIVALASLPMTQNGKVDRKALPPPRAERPALATGFVVPRSETEEVLAGIWAQVLGIDRVGIEDNFFALGGDSILSLRVVGLAGERGLSISLPEIFQHQTLAELAAAVGQRDGEEIAPTQPFELVAEVDRALLPDVEDAYPLAMLQAGMLYHMELLPEDPPYLNVDSWHVRGRFEREPFFEAARRVVARHPMLRTSFALEGFSEPLQLVHRTAELPIVVEDLKGLPEDVQEAMIDRLVRSEKTRRFALFAAPQIRFHVHLRATDRFQFTLTENHAIFDGWSLHSTLAEIFELYFALLAGPEPAAEPPVTLTYRDFVATERRALASAETEAFWWRALTEGPLLDLPCRLPPDEAPKRRVETEVVSVPEPVSAGLKRAAIAAAVPLKSLLLAAHAKVLGLIAGQGEVVTGLVANGRLEGVDGDRVRGLFLNTLPLRMRLAPGSWLDLAQRVFAAERDLLPHRRYPFAALQRAWGERRIFEVAFNFIHFHAVENLLASGNIEVLEFRRIEPSNLLLQVHFGIDLLDGGIKLELDYDTGRLSRAEARIFAGFFERTLAAISSDPHGIHQEFSPLSAAERHQLVTEWSDTAVAPAAGPCVHTLFERQAEKTPAAVAVTCGGVSLTYRDLAERSDELARHLRGLGVGPGKLVGLSVERSPDMVVGLLGILRAGGAYLPLDPLYPSERLAWVLADSGASVLVTETGLLDRLGEHGARVVMLDAPLTSGSKASVPPCPLDLAYVIYTSGSTGKPKGVAVPHAAVVNFLDSMRREPGLATGETLLAVTTLSFDIAALELLLPLVVGARVAIADREDAADGARLLDLLASSRAQVLQATPATWRLLLEAGWERSGPRPRALCGGEALPRELADRLLPLSSGLWNMYGPTETTVWSAIDRVDSGSGPVSIGRPIANTQLHVLDRDLQVIPLGTPGELLIGGAGVVRGYFRRPDLTAERFVPDPFASRPGERLYRTGDLCRRLSDGKVEFLGRLDHQVKVRGFRIETGEVEAALAEHPSVREAVVVAREDRAGDRRLVGYVALDPAAPPTAEELRRYLSAKLPAYMVPSVLVILPELPRTPNGKLDRAALPPPSTAEPAGAEGRATVGPRTPVEEVLAGIWSGVLGVERVGVDDDFFALGGHSLLATRLVSRLRATFGVELPLRALFQAPTLAALAARIEQARAAGGAAAPPIEPVPRDGDLPLSFAQQRLWFVHQLAPRSAGYNMWSALKLTGRLEVRVLARSLSEVVRRHETLRTTFPSLNGRPVQAIAAPQPVALPLVDLTALSESLRAALAPGLIGELATRPFELERGPLLRTMLLRLAAEEHLALFAVHHIVSDAWSLAVLVDEVGAFYTAFLVGRPSPLAELPVQYADVAAWQRRWLEGDVLARHLSYWRERLGGAPPVLALPTDRPRPATKSGHGGMLLARLSQDLAERVSGLSRGEEVTLFMTLLAAFSCVLGFESDSSDIVVGTDAANRNRLESEGLIGFLVNTLALRTDLSGNPSFRELLGRARETCLGAYAHQDLPFERLVEELQPERRPGVTPLVQVSFNLHNAPARRLELPGLSVESLETERQAARFDLVVNMWEEGGTLVGTWEYDRDLFLERRVAAFIESFSILLERVVADPGLPLVGLKAMLAEAARERVVREGRQLQTAGRQRFAGVQRRSVGVS